jgi:hypothetical protein
VTVEHVEFIVEEPSAEAALAVLLPRMLGGITHAIHAHRGKHDLLRSLPGRLQGYVRWLPASWRIAILVDQDDEDCKALKRRLERICASSGLNTRRRPALSPAWTVVNRVAVQELESWFFGDWDAVAEAYPGVPATLPRQARFRDPDAITNTWEALERVLKQAGYHAAGLPKITAARDIAEHMDPARNRSHSFQVLRATLEDIVRM